MAVEFNIPAKEWFLGEAKMITVPVLGQDGLTPVDATGWKLEYTIRKKAESTEFILQKTSTSVPPGITVSGVFNVDPTLNQQRVRIAFSRGDTLALKSEEYSHALGRTDTGLEGVLFHGKVVLTSSAMH